MELVLSKRDRDAIVHDLAIVVVRKLREELKKQEPPEMVTTAEAAKILGITPKSMRRNAEKYPHIKKGESKQAQYLFVRSALLES